MIAAYSMYVIGLLMAILVAFIIHLFDKRKAEFNLLIELPEYKAPSARTIAIYVWEKVKELWGRRIYIRHHSELRIGRGEGDRPAVPAAGAGILADCRCADRRGIRERGGGFQLFCSLWNRKCDLAGGDDESFNRSGGHGIRNSERLLYDDFLPALYPLYRHAGYD